MTPIETIGTLALGVVLTLAVLGGFVLYVFRGHRADWTGLRIVRSDQWQPKPPQYGWVTGSHPSLDPATLSGPHDDGSYAARVHLDGDSERPPAVQHGQRTREVGGDG